MGIKNLHNFLKKTCPNVYTTVPISKYAFKKIAIDTSIFMCKYKSSSGNNFIDSFLHLISVLRYNEVHFVFVYDTKAPPEKDKERKHRIEAREKNKVRVEKIRDHWIQYKEDKNISDNDSVPSFETIEDDVLQNFIMKCMENDPGNIVACKKVDIEILKLQNTILSIRTEDFNLTKEFFKACQVPFINAEGEAEATATALAKQGMVTAVLTEDTDVLAYGTPFMLHKMDVAENTFLEVDYEEILHQLQFTRAQFLDFCILCGTDYNNNLHKIGPEKAYKLMQQYGSIDGIYANNPHLQVPNLNHEKVRSLFVKPLEFKEPIPYCGFPDKHVLENLYFMNNCKFDLDKLYNSLQYSIFHEFDIKQLEEKKKKHHLLLCNYNKPVTKT